jgi:hypothetical protein
MKCECVSDHTRLTALVLLLCLGVVTMTPPREDEDVRRAAPSRLGLWRWRRRIHQIEAAASFRWKWDQDRCLSPPDNHTCLGDFLFDIGRQNEDLIADPCALLADRLLARSFSISTERSRMRVTFRFLWAGAFNI